MTIVYFREHIVSSFPLLLSFIPSVVSRRRKLSLIVLSPSIERVINNSGISSSVRMIYSLLMKKFILKSIIFEQRREREKERKIENLM